MLIEKGVNLHCAFWHQRRVVLYDIDAQKEHFCEDTKAIKNESKSGVIENFKNCTDSHPKNEEVDLIKT